MLLVQKFLRNGGSLEDLQNQFALKATRSSVHPSLVLLKYNQIDSPFAEPIVRECRGLILDETADWAIVSHPFHKFFNYGEGHASKIDWDSVEVQEKVDGSLIGLYWYGGQWNIQTSGTPDANGELKGYPDLTFRKLFLSTLEEMGLELPPETFHAYTLLFELTAPQSRVIVHHEKAQITLLAIRDLKGIEQSAEAFKLMGLPDYPIAKSFPLKTMDDILETFPKVSPVKQEGYVLKDKYGNRIKVKHPGYVALHSLKDGFGARRILELVRIGETSEVLAYFPEWLPLFAKVQTKFEEFVDGLQTTYDNTKHIENQKEFALAIRSCRYPPALFAVRCGKFKTIRGALADMNIRTLLQLLKLGEIELPGSGV